MSKARATSASDRGASSAPSPTGSASMPTGSIFGGSHDEGGDLNRLMNEYGWAAEELTRFYTSLAFLTGMLILAVYVGAGSRRWSRSSR